MLETGNEAVNVKKAKLLSAVFSNRIIVRAKQTDNQSINQVFIVKCCKIMCWYVLVFKC